MSDFQQKCHTIWRFISRFKGSGSNKWNCLLFCFLSGSAACCHPVICSVNERKLDALQLTRSTVYFRVQCGIKMWIDFVYWVICKQKMNHNICWNKIVILVNWLHYHKGQEGYREKMKLWDALLLFLRKCRRRRSILDSQKQIYCLTII